MSLEKVHILIIEDDISDVELLQEYLSEIDSKSIFSSKASSLSEGLELLSKKIFNLIFLDLTLPDCQGKLTFLQIKEKNPMIPVVILSGLSDFNVATDAVSQGAQDYLVKGEINTKILERSIFYAIERKKLEIRNFYNERNLQKIIQKNSDAILVVNSLGRILFANQAAEMLFGKSIEELKEQDFGYPIKESVEIDILYNKRIAEMRSVEFIWEEKQAFLLTIRDITQQKKMQQEILDAKQRWEDIFNAIGHPTMLLSPDHTILKANNAVFDLFKNNQKVIGEKCYKLFHLAKKSAKNCPAKKLLTSQKIETFEMEIEALNKTFIITCTPVLNSFGELESIIHIATDITELQTTKKKLIEKQEQLKIINKFLRHDLANNLVTITSACNVMKRKKDVTYWDEIEENVNKSLELINQMKTMETMLDRTNKLIKMNVAETIRSVIQKYPHANFELDGNAVVNADQSLSSIFDNLIGNALKHGAAKKISFFINSQEDFIQIDVQNDGKKIPLNVIDQVFEENASFGKKGNTGLGLYLIKKKMEFYKGSVWVDSAKNTIFHLKFPNEQ